VSDSGLEYDHSEFGFWDTEYASYYLSSDLSGWSVSTQVAYRTQPLPPLPSTSFIAPLPEITNALGEGPTPPGSPVLLFEDTIKREQSPSPDNLTLLANVAQITEREDLPEDLPSIVNYIRSPSPDLRYPSPAPLPIPPPAPPVSPPVRPAAPVPCPASAVGFLRITTPDLQPLIPPPPRALSDSPIDYEAAALRVERREPTPVIPEPLEDQENRPPIPVIRPPPCIGVEGPHPHQYFVVATPRGEEHCPLDNSGPTYINNIPFAENLRTRPPHFTGVILFQTTLPHFQTIFPPYRALAIDLGIPPLYTCSKAIFDSPSPDLPLGTIKYDFRRGIREAFAPLNELIKQAYTNTLVVLEVQDFLDRWVVTTFGYLAFQGTSVFRLYQAQYFDNAARTAPLLLSYCLTPRLPLDPFEFISTFEDNEPL
jgi:hypothetical protein